MNIADESQVKEQGAKVKRSRERELNDVREILNTKGGRRFMWRYLSECGIFRTSFNNSGSVTAFNEGARNVGLILLADITEAAPDAYTLMTKEAKEQD